MLSRRFLIGLNALFDRIENSFRFNNYFQSSTIIIFFFSTPNYLNSNIEKSLLQAKIIFELKIKKKKIDPYSKIRSGFFFSMPRFSRIVRKVFHAQTI